MRKADKISIELGCESWREIPLKRPSRMRVATFERLRTKRAKLVAEINRQIAVRLATKRGDLLQQMVSLVKLGV
jgi:hypothetical protein